MARKIELFWDETDGGFFFTSDDHEALIARAKDPFDTVLPSGNSISVSNLVFLADALGEPEYLERAVKAVQSFGVYLESAPSAMPRMVTAISSLREATAGPPAGG